ncbi:MAG: AEC family transporter [Immundisolibacter sp.]|uniref:AEC family transporter n=1 Tax=Immundisolibacter sp. TaxID=1934948 RepID=UPI003EE331D7
MYLDLLPVFLALAAGWLWRRHAPGGVDAQQMALALNMLMIYLTGPALIFAIMSQAKLDLALTIIPAAGYVCSLGGLALAAVVYRLWGNRSGLTPGGRGALLLAASFANGSIALPVVVSLFGHQGMATVFAYDLIATTLLIWTVGVAVAARHAAGQERLSLGREILRLPPAWAVMIALAVNLLGMPVPERAVTALRYVGDASIPLMVFVVGLSLRLGALRRLPVALPALFIRQVAGPAMGLAFAYAFGVRGETLAILGVVMASACPAVGVILAHRFRLDIELYGAVLTASILSYLALAPLYRWLLMR